MTEHSGQNHQLKMRSICLFIRSISCFVKDFLHIGPRKPILDNPCPVLVYYFIRYTVVVLTGTSESSKKSVSYG